MEEESLVLSLLHEVRQEQIRVSEIHASFAKSLDEFKVFLHEHEKKDLACYDEFKEVISKSFPNGDTNGHRAYHENVIAWYELRNSLVREALGMAVKTGGIAAAGWICFALWQAAKMSILGK